MFVHVQVTEVSGEVEVLMERMKQLQECRDEEEASQEEMATRFEREKTESMLVATAGKSYYVHTQPYRIQSPTYKSIWTVVC